MSQSFWESEEVEQAQVEQEPEAVEPVEPEEPEEPAEVALSADEFSALEERILRTVDLVKSERRTRVEAEERAVAAEAQMHEQTLLHEQQQHELETLRGERDQVRQRIERLLKQLDSLEL
jgi:hypothetical protein